MKLDKLAPAAVVACALVLACGCGDDPAQPEPGVVSVSVLNMGNREPVGDVEITISPANVVAETAADGKATFRLPPGNYFVDASVCCIGPGFIQHHVPITVTAGKTTEVTLDACLDCL